MTVVQCPRCELRFRLDQEAAHHLSVDHRGEAAGLAEVMRERAAGRRRSRRRPLASAAVGRR